VKTNPLLLPMRNAFAAVAIGIGSWVVFGLLLFYVTELPPLVENLDLPWLVQMVVILGGWWFLGILAAMINIRACTRTQGRSMFLAVLLRSLIRDRSESLTTHMGYPVFMEEELLNMLGYMSMEMDQPEKAHAIFELLIEYYPGSASAHSAMADYFESQNDVEHALLHARKAFDMSGSDELQHRVEALMKRR